MIWRDKEQVLDGIRDLAEKKGYASSNANRGLTNAAQRFFYNWQTACEAAGVKSYQDHKQEKTQAKVRSNAAVKADCLMYNERRKKCNALKLLECDGCGFYKKASEQERKRYEQELKYLD